MVWETAKVDIQADYFGTAVAVFNIYDKKGNHYGSLNPATIDGHRSILDKLNAGECPVGGGWHIDKEGDNTDWDIY